jgi:hypothetical protein
MKFLASSNKKVVLPIVVVFTFISLFFIYNLSNEKKFNNNNTTTKHLDIIENTANVDHLQITKAEWESCLSPGEEPTEYLSIVIVTRVDNYAG